MIVQGLLEDQDTLSVMTLDPGLEQLLHNVLQQSQGGQIVLEPELAENLFEALRRGSQTLEGDGLAPVLVVSPAIRSWLARAARHRVSDLTVLSYSEIPDDQSVKVVHTVEAKPKD
jgi:flagellar biosynthesis protein FlhA